MDIHQAVAEARRYLWLSHIDGKPKDILEKYQMNRPLQYHLCGAFSRLEKAHGAHNITDKDIHMLVESWMIAQGAMSCMPRDKDGNLYYPDAALILHTHTEKA